VIECVPFCCPCVEDTPGRLDLCLSDILLERVPSNLGETRSSVDELFRFARLRLKSVDCDGPIQDKHSMMFCGSVLILENM